MPPFLLLTSFFTTIFTTTMARKKVHTEPTQQLIFPPDSKSEDSRKEDHRLVQLALRGNEGAYIKLREKYYQSLWHFVARIIKKHDDVDDLIQETFIKAFTSLSSYNNEYAFSTWLYKIATNSSIDYLRKKKLPTFSIDNPIETDDDEFRFELPDNNPVPDQLLIAKQRSHMLEEAMNSLPAKYRKVILMRHVEEMEYSEIAKALNIPLGTVKAHIFRAREILYKQLKKKMRHY